MVPTIVNANPGWPSARLREPLLHRYFDLAAAVEPPRPPGLHRCPCDEVGIFDHGEATFRAGGRRPSARIGRDRARGDAYWFRNTGSAPLQTTRGHPRPAMETEWPQPRGRSQPGRGTR